MIKVFLGILARHMLFLPALLVLCCGPIALSDPGSEDAIGSALCVEAASENTGVCEVAPAVDEMQTAKVPSQEGVPSDNSAGSKNCNDNYLVAAQPVRHNLTDADFFALNLFIQKEDPEAGWRYLSTHGDGYAKMALMVVQTRFRPSTFLKHSLIRTHWIHTTGIKDFKEKFKAVAVQHLRQYVGILEKGFWPDSDQILLSYIAALKMYDIKPTTAFDLNWQYSFLEPMLTWQEAVDLTKERIVDPSQVCTKAPRAKSNLTIIGDFLLMIPEGLGYGISTGFK